MRSRIFFAVIAGFWLVMNFLLWRSQSGAHSQIGSAIPVEIVWDKILTAPDNSSLDIYDHGKKTGFCQWMVNTGGAAQALNQSLSKDYAPDGLIPQPGGYGLSLEGNTAIFGTNRVRFEMQLRLSTNQTWQDFRFTAKMRPAVWDIHANAAAQKIMVKVNGDGGSWQKTVKFSDFQHPESLLEEFGGTASRALRGPRTSLCRKIPSRKRRRAYGGKRMRIGCHLAIPRCGSIAWKRNYSDSASPSSPAARVKSFGWRRRAN